MLSWEEEQLQEPCSTQPAEQMQKQQSLEYKRIVIECCQLPIMHISKTLQYNAISNKSDYSTCGEEPSELTARAILAGCVCVAVRDETGDGGE